MNTRYESDVVAWANEQAALIFCRKTGFQLNAARGTPSIMLA